MEEKQTDQNAIDAQEVIPPQSTVASPPESIQRENKCVEVINQALAQYNCRLVPSIILEETILRNVKVVANKEEASKTTHNTAFN